MTTTCSPLRRDAAGRSESRRGAAEPRPPPGAPRRRASRSGAARRPTATPPRWFAGGVVSRVRRSPEPSRLRSAASARRAAGRRIGRLDVSRFRIGDWVLVGAGAAMLVLGLAVPWVTVTFRGNDLPGALNAFDYPLTGGIALGARGRRRRHHVPAGRPAAARRQHAVDAPGRGRDRARGAAARDPPRARPGRPRPGGPRPRGRDDRRHRGRPRRPRRRARQPPRRRRRRPRPVGVRPARRAASRRRCPGPVPPRHRATTSLRRRPDRRRQVTASRRGRPSARRPRSGCARLRRRRRRARPSSPARCPCRPRRWRRRGPSSCRPGR